MISGQDFKNQSELYKTCFKNVTQIFEKHNQPYLYILGNHDREGDFSPSDLYHMDS